MKNDLTPLKAWEEVKDEMCYGDPDLKEAYEENFDIIETALRRLDQYETPTRKKDIMSVAKRLTALEIIKEKKVNVRCLMSGWVLGKYNSYKSHIRLTEKEYDLLKEILL